MVNFPGGFPGGFPGRPPGTPGGPPPSRPPGTPGGPPTSRPPGGPPPPRPGGMGNPPPPPPQLISRFQTLNQNPAQAQRMLQPQGGITTFAAGCDGRWTIVLLRNGQLFLMYVFSSSVVGNTTGIIWPNFTFASFPSSAIAAYSCY